MHPDLLTLLPTEKTDTEKAQGVIALGFPAVEPVLPLLLEWTKDMNWPVARVLQPFLASIGAPLAPHVRNVLATTDEIWKFWVLHCIVRESADLVVPLQAELLRLAKVPTPSEIEEKLDIEAREILEAYGIAYA